MSCTFSVLVPGIRTSAWPDLYKSIESATVKDFEVIFVGPNAPPPELQELPNVKFVRDFGHPARCQQIALQIAEGLWTTWVSDDAIFLEKSIDSMYGLLGQQMIGVTGKYMEGSTQQDYDTHMSDAYYFLSFHAPTRLPHIPTNWHIFNVGLVETQVLKQLGGWDGNNFEACPMSHADLAVRIQRAGIPLKLTSGFVLKCGHMPADTGDHGPIHYAQVEHDEPVFRMIYSDPNCVHRISIPLDNWVHTSRKWVRRFK